MERGNLQLSLVRNNEINLPASYMDIPTGNHLVPYYPGQNQIVPNTPKATRILPPSDDPASRRYALFPRPFSTRTDNQPDYPEAAYNFSLGLVQPKMNQVGLLIDIYA